MATYKAPLRDIEFVLNEIAGVHELTRIPRYAEMTPDLIIGVLDEAAKLFERTVAPLNRGADEEGARFHADTGNVSTPKGFKEAYDAFRRGG